MADEMASRQIPLTIIVAATTKNGIGKDGALPWPTLKKELAYFARVTKRVPVPRNTGSSQSDAFKQNALEGAQRNAVIMGRRTWDSIPPKFRPLRDRTNIVISSQGHNELDGVTEEVIVAGDISSGLMSLKARIDEGKALPLGRAFVIGGTSTYSTAMALSQTNRILLTRIHKDYECDTFLGGDMPNDDTVSTNGWQRASNQTLREFVGEEVPAGLVEESSGENTVQFEYQLFERY